MIEKISYEQVNQTADSLNNSASKMKEILAEVEQRMQKVNTEDTCSRRIICKIQIIINKI